MFFKKDYLEQSDIQTIPIDTIITCARADGAFEERCKKEELDSFWREQIAQLGVSEEVLLPATITPLFNQFRACYFFLAACACNDEQSKVQELKEAISFGSFHAAYMRLKLIETEINQGVSEKESYLDEISTMMDQLLLFNCFTPSYLLMVEAYYLLSSFYKKGSHYSVLYEEQAYAALLLAEALLPFSEAALNSATVFTSLNELFPDFSDIDQAKAFLQDQLMSSLAEGDRMDATLSRLKKQADQWVEGIKEKYQEEFQLHQPFMPMNRH